MRKLEKPLVVVKELVVPQYLMANTYSVSLFDAHLNDYGFGPLDISSISVSVGKTGHQINLGLRVPEILDIEDILKIKFLKLFFLDNDGIIKGDNIFEIKEVSVDFALSYSICDVLYYNLKLIG